MPSSVSTRVRSFARSYFCASPTCRCQCSLACRQLVYEPKVKYHVGDKSPPRISCSIFGWIAALIRTREPELIDKIGLDAVTFLRFLRMMRYAFTAAAVLACAVLIPINVTYSVAHVEAKDRDLLSILTIRDVKGYLLFAHVGMVYVITLIILVGVARGLALLAR